MKLTTEDKHILIEMIEKDSDVSDIMAFLNKREEDYYDNLAVIPIENAILKIKETTDDSDW